MGWERRQRGGLYFYKSVRINGQPRKRYLGAGPAAQSFAQMEVEKQQRRQAERAALEAEQTQVAAADAVSQELRLIAGLLTRATLLLAGFHEHHREWRRRHDRIDAKRPR